MKGKMIAVDVATDERGAGTPHRPRRVMVVVIVAVVVAAAGGLATLLTLRHLDRQYGPIERWRFSGPTNPDEVRGRVTDHERLNVKPGGTVQWMESLTNAGSHSAKITSIQTDQIVTAIRWSVYKLGPTNFGRPTPWRNFPAIVPGHNVIRLLVTIRRPLDCDSVLHGPGGAVFYDGIHTVHWDSLLGSHTTVISDPLIELVRVC